jgi:hypothetical protein
MSMWAEIPAKVIFRMLSRNTLAFFSMILTNSLTPQKVVQYTVLCYLLETKKHVKKLLTYLPLGVSRSGT